MGLGRVGASVTVGGTGVRVRVGIAQGVVSILLSMDEVKAFIGVLVIAHVLVAVALSVIVSVGVLQRRLGDFA